MVVVVLVVLWGSGWVVCPLGGKGWVEGGYVTGWCDGGGRYGGLVGFRVGCMSFGRKGVGRGR